MNDRTPLSPRAFDKDDAGDDLALRDVAEVRFVIRNPSAFDLDPACEVRGLLGDDGFNRERCHVAGVLFDADSRPASARRVVGTVG